MAFLVLAAIAVPSSLTVSIFIILIGTFLRIFFSWD